MKMPNPRTSTGANAEKIAWRAEHAAVAIRLLSQMHKVIDYFDQSCAYCGAKDQNLTWDHLVPVTKGGHTVFGNIVTACKTCNSSKGALEFREWMFKRTGKAPSAKKSQRRATKKRFETLLTYQEQLETNVEFQEIKEKLLEQKDEIDQRRQNIECIRKKLKSELNDLAAITKKVRDSVVNKG